MAKYRYLVVVEKAKGNYSANVPDLPGCVTTGKTMADIHRNIQEAIELHLEGMGRSGETINERNVTDDGSHMCYYVCLREEF